MHQVMPKDWQINGKLAVQVPDQNQPTLLQSHVLRFSWQQHSDDDFTPQPHWPIECWLNTRHQTAKQSDNLLFKGIDALNQTMQSGYYLKKRIYLCHRTA